MLHDVGCPDLGVAGILAGVAAGPALAEQVPALVELHLDLAEPARSGVVQLLVAVLALQLMLLSDELVDAIDDLASFIGGLPNLAPVSFVTVAT